MDKHHHGPPPGEDWYRKHADASKTPFSAEDMEAVAELMRNAKHNGFIYFDEGHNPEVSKLMQEMARATGTPYVKAVQAFCDVSQAIGRAFSDNTGHYTFENCSFAPPRKRYKPYDGKGTQYRQRRDRFKDREKGRRK